MPHQASHEPRPPIQAAESKQRKTRAVTQLKRRKILLETAQLFTKTGFAGTSMSDIAAKAGITKAGLYHFFESKEDILFEIVTIGMEDVFHAVIEPAQRIADPLDRLKSIIRNHMLGIGRVATPDGNPFVIVADNLSGLTAEHLATIEATKREYFDFMRDTLRALKADGRLHVWVDDTIATFSILGVVVHLGRWRKPDGRASLEEIIDQTTQMLLGGLLAKN